MARIHLFRIAQESLINVARHARAQRVRIFLGALGHGAQSRMRLVVRDDGVGADPNAPTPGYGLIVMRERARNLDGTFKFRSQAGVGTRIAVMVPMKV